MVEIKMLVTCVDHTIWGADNGNPILPDTMQDSGLEKEWKEWVDLVQQDEWWKQSVKVSGNFQQKLAVSLNHWMQFTLFQNPVVIIPKPSEDIQLDLSRPVKEMTAFKLVGWEMTGEHITWFDYSEEGKWIPMVDSQDWKFWFSSILGVRETLSAFVESFLYDRISSKMVSRTQFKPKIPPRKNLVSKSLVKNVSNSKTKSSTSPTSSDQFVESIPDWHTNQSILEPDSWNTVPWELELKSELELDTAKRPVNAVDVYLHLLNNQKGPWVLYDDQTAHDLNQWVLHVVKTLSHKKPIMVNVITNTFVGRLTVQSQTATIDELSSLSSQELKVDECKTNIAQLVNDIEVTISPLFKLNDEKWKSIWKAIPNEVIGPPREVPNLVPENDWKETMNLFCSPIDYKLDGIDRLNMPSPSEHEDPTRRSLLYWIRPCQTTGELTTKYNDSWTKVNSYSYLDVGWLRLDCHVLSAFFTKCDVSHARTHPITGAFNMICLQTWSEWMKTSDNIRVFVCISELQNNQPTERFNIVNHNQLMIYHEKHWKYAVLVHRVEKDKDNTEVNVFCVGDYETEKISTIVTGLDQQYAFRREWQQKVNVQLVQPICSPTQIFAFIVCHFIQPVNSPSVMSAMNASHVFFMNYLIQSKDFPHKLFQYHFLSHGMYEFMHSIHDKKTCPCPQTRDQKSDQYRLNWNKDPDLKHRFEKQKDPELEWVKSRDSLFLFDVFDTAIQSGKYHESTNPCNSRYAHFRSIANQLETSRFEPNEYSHQLLHAIYGIICQRLPRPPTFRLSLRAKRCKHSGCSNLAAIHKGCFQYCWRHSTGSERNQMASDRPRHARSNMLWYPTQIGCHPKIRHPVIEKNLLKQYRASFALLAKEMEDKAHTIFILPDGWKQLAHSVRTILLNDAAGFFKYLPERHPPSWLLKDAAILEKDPVEFRLKLKSRMNHLMKLFHPTTVSMFTSDETILKHTKSICGAIFQIWWDYAYQTNNDEVVETKEKHDNDIELGYVGLENDHDIELGYVGQAVGLEPDHSLYETALHLPSGPMWSAANLLVHPPTLVDMFPLFLESIQGRASKKVSYQLAKCMFGADLNHKDCNECIISLFALFPLASPKKRYHIALSITQWISLQRVL
jgi:hypothetical protein